MRDVQVNFFFVRRADRVEEAREHVTNIAMSGVIRLFQSHETVHCNSGVSIETLKPDGLKAL